MKKLLLVPLLTLFVVLSIGYWFFVSFQSVNNENNSFQEFVIEKGASASKVGKDLEDKKLIKSALAFKIYVQLTGKTSSIQAGEYRISPSFSLAKIVSQFGKGPLQILVTIPEGLRREEIANKFATSLGRDKNFVNDFLAETKADEGYLFPETYFFPRDVSASSIVSKMKATFNGKTSGLKLNNGLTLKETIILASLIERETKTDIERPMVSGILLNRIRVGMPLQVDATVQYAMGNSKIWWPTPLRGDLEISSPYNTYKNIGLPPGPIANPGLSSIKAAANPETSSYFYYIHDKNGQIHYAKTISEQNANVQKYIY